MLVMPGFLSQDNIYSFILTYKQFLIVPDKLLLISQILHQQLGPKITFYIKYVIFY